jgi:hypothetical protein
MRGICLLGLGFALVSSFSCSLPAPVPDPEPEMNSYGIVARDPFTGDIGAVFLSHVRGGVGKCVFVKPGVGAIISLSRPSPSHGSQGLDLLAQGKDASSVLAELLKGDKTKTKRQIAVIGPIGSPAGHTGQECTEWCGQIVGRHHVVMGNRLENKKTLQEIDRVFKSTQGSLAGRMARALVAGNAAGGDKEFMGVRKVGDSPAQIVGGCAELTVCAIGSGEKPNVHLTTNNDTAPWATMVKKFQKEASDSYAIGDRNFGKGDAGGDVLELERFLKEAGVLEGEPDKTFDDATKDALKEYQRKNKLLPTGRMDKDTRDHFWDLRKQKGRERWKERAKELKEKFKELKRGAEEGDKKGE